MLIHLSVDSNNVWRVKIPQGLSGPHVLRTEAFALMGAGNLGHAQLYPQCINLNIQGSGAGVDPCAGGADCRLGRDLYRETDPGIFISIHKAIARYQIPGPALWQGTSSQAPNSTPQPVSSEPETSKHKADKHKSSKHRATPHKISHKTKKHKPSHHHSCDQNLSRENTSHHPHHPHPPHRRSKHQ